MFCCASSAWYPVAGGAEAILFRGTQLGRLDLARLFNASPNPYVILDTELTIVGCNAAYLKVVGRAAVEDIVGRNVFDAFPSDPASVSGRILRASFQKVLSEGVVDHLAVLPYDTSGPGETPQLRYWSATHTPVFDDEGKIAYILQHTVDVTELQTLRQRDAAGSIAEAGVLGRAQAVQAENDTLALETGQLRNLFQQAPSFMAVLSGPDHIFELANAAYLRLIGRGDVIGKSLEAVLPEALEQGFVGLLDRVLASGMPYVGRSMQLVLEGADGRADEKYLDFIYQPIQGGRGETVGVFVQGHDVTDQKRAELALSKQTEFLALAQDAGGVGTFEWDIGKGTLRSSAMFRRLYGITDLGEDAAELPVERFTEVVHPEDRDHLAIHGDLTIADAIHTAEYRVKSPEGWRWIGRRGVVIHDRPGHPARVMGAAYDLTERKQFETRLETIAHESAHRVKNMLAMVQAIVTQSLRREPDPERASAVITERLMALAQAQSALIIAGGKTASLKDVVRSATELQRQTFGQIAIADGRDAMLDERTVMGLGLMLHELATNAVKYGALSVPTGLVDIEWQFERIDGEDMARLFWRELGGPPAATPTKKGFGSRLIERGLSHHGRNSVALDYRPEGLVCTALLKVN